MVKHNHNTNCPVVRVPQVSPQMPSRTSNFDAGLKITGRMGRAATISAGGAIGVPSFPLSSCRALRKEYV